MSEHRGHLGGALLTIAGAALIGAGPGSMLLIVLGALCIVGALWAFGLWTALARGIQWLTAPRGRRASNMDLSAIRPRRTGDAHRISGQAIERASDNLLRSLDRDGADEEPEQPKPTPQFEKWLRKRHARGKDECQKVAIVRAELLTAFAALSVLSPSFKLKAITGTVNGWGRELSDGLRKAGFTDEAEDAAGSPPAVDDEPTTADCDALTAYIETRMRIIQSMLSGNRS